jgi:hypothetical protein
VWVGIEIDFVIEVLQGGVQLMLNDDLRYDLASPRPRNMLAAGFPEDDVQDHVVEVRIVLVPVMVPILGAQMQLNIARALRFFGNLNGCMTKVGAGFEVPPTLEDDAHRAAIVRSSPSFSRWSYQMHWTSRSLIGMGT